MCHRWRKALIEWNSLQDFIEETYSQANKYDYIVITEDMRARLGSPMSDIIGEYREQIINFNVRKILNFHKTKKQIHKERELDHQWITQWLMRKSMCVEGVHSDHHILWSKLK